MTTTACILDGNIESISNSSSIEFTIEYCEMTNLSNSGVIRHDSSRRGRTRGKIRHCLRIRCVKIASVSKGWLAPRSILISDQSSNNSRKENERGNKDSCHSSSW